MQHLLVIRQTLGDFVFIFSLNIIFCFVFFSCRAEAQRFFNTLYNNIHDLGNMFCVTSLYLVSVLWRQGFYSPFYHWDSIYFLLIFLIKHDLFNRFINLLQTKINLIPSIFKIKSHITIINYMYCNVYC